MTDILAVDAAGNLVVVEVKRGQTPRDVVAQALEYASQVADWDYDRLNQAAIRYFPRRKLAFKSLKEAFSETFDVPLNECAESLFNREQRVFIVAERIDKKVERTARWLLNRRVSISCVSYDCYVSDDPSRETFLDFNQIVRPNDVQSGWHSRAAAPQPPTEDMAIDRLPDNLKSLYQKLRTAVMTFGDDVETYATQNNFIFKAARVFAEIPQKRSGCRFVVHVRPEGYSIPENENDLIRGVSVKRLPDSYKWNVNHRFEVTEETDLDAVIELLRQSYDGARQRR